MPRRRGAKADAPSVGGEAGAVGLADIKALFEQTMSTNLAPVMERLTKLEGWQEKDAETRGQMPMRTSPEARLKAYQMERSQGVKGIARGEFATGTVNVDSRSLHAKAPLYHGDNPAAGIAADVVRVKPDSEPAEAMRLTWRTEAVNGVRRHFSNVLFQKPLARLNAEEMKMMEADPVFKKEREAALESAGSRPMPIGAVIKPLYVTKRGTWKYRVRLEDSKEPFACLESEMELAHGV